MLKIQVILGSTREGRQGEKVAQWFMNEAKKRQDMDVELLDLRDYPLPFFDETMSPMALAGNYQNDIAQKWSNTIKQADGYVFITPEYNHSYSAVLKNALDYAYFEWNKKPGAIISYSTLPTAGVRALEQLRSLIVQLQLIPVFNSVTIPNVSHAFDEKGEIVDETMSKRAQGLLDQTLWWATLLKPAREALH